MISGGLSPGPVSSSVSCFSLQCYIITSYERRRRACVPRLACVGAGDKRTVHILLTVDSTGTQLVLLFETPVICVSPIFLCRFLFIPSGPFLLGCNARPRRFEAFLLGYGGDARGPRDYTLPSPALQAGPGRPWPERSPWRGALSHHR